MPLGTVTLASALKSIGYQSKTNLEWNGLNQ